MTPSFAVRRGAALLATLVAGAGLAATSAHAEAPAVTAAPPAHTARAVARTTLTFAVPDCKKCTITLHQAIEHRPKVWQTGTKRVHDGLVTFTVPTKRTHGLDATVRGPWEGPHSVPAGYVSQVVFRYAHEKPGSRVTFKDARGKKRASACWAGTDATEVTIPLKVRKVRVQGTTGPTNGTLAWTKNTQAFWMPMERTVEKGIFGTQDVPFCAKP